ncbi:TetR/AcrR family transcriptional regulator [Streptomyces sp. NPDC048473]|uniref:TetR/AcrR family transcriptional regulator n=1 Tax=unclassified Streptomyces TaxID=2593676 RepID=UPI00371A4C16
MGEIPDDSAERHCRTCGAQLESKARGRPPVYCGRACQSKAFRARNAKTAPPQRLPRQANAGTDAVLELAELIGKEVDSFVSQLDSPAGDESREALAHLNLRLPVLMAQLLDQAGRSTGSTPPGGTSAAVSTRAENGDTGAAGEAQGADERKRGPYAKGVVRRAEILSAALETIAERGYHQSTFQEIAERVGVRPGVITHYFGSRQNLMTAIVDARDMVDAPARTAAGGDVRRLLQQLHRIPGLVKLYVNISAEATDEAHDGHDFFMARYARLRDTLADEFRQRQAAGVIDADADPAWLARATLALADGLQLQWLYEPGLDAGGDIETFLDRAARPTSSH